MPADLTLLSNGAINNALSYLSVLTKRLPNNSIIVSTLVDYIFTQYACQTFILKYIYKVCLYALKLFMFVV